MAQDSSDGVIWFVAGVAIGATIGILFAPASGEETRRKIGRKAEEGRQALTESGRDVMDKGKELYEKGRHLADEAAEIFDRGRKLVQG